MSHSRALVNPLLYIAITRMNNRAVPGMNFQRNETSSKPPNDTQREKVLVCPNTANSLAPPTPPRLMHARNISQPRG